jgi:PAS domain S-box-containing protein
MKLSLGTRIFFGFLVVMLAFAAVLTFAAVRFHTLGTRLHQLGETYLNLSKIATQMEATHNTRRVDLARVMELDDPASRAVLARHIRNGFRKLLWDKVRYAQAVIERGERTGAFTRDDPFTRGLGERIDKIDRMSGDYEDAAISLLTALETSADDSAARYQSLKDVDQRLSRELRLFVGMMEAKISSITQETIKEESSITWSVIFWSVMALIVAVVVLVLFQVALAPMSALREKVAEIARGNYGMRTGIETGDEVGLLAAAIDDMARSLQQREREIAETSEKYLRATTDLRRANTDLIVQRNINENIFRSIRSAIISLDERGRVTSMNPAAEFLWSSRAREMAGKTIGDLEAWRSVPEAAGILDRVMVGREIVRLDSVPLGGEGGEPLVDLTLAPLQGEGGELRGALIIGEDVTERVRTKQLLIHSERLAAVGKLAAQITHEIRNPLSSIGLNAELLEEPVGELGDPEAVRLLTAIQSEIGRLAEITEEYLSVARPPASRFREVDVNEVVTSLAAFMGMEFSRGNVKMHCDCSDDVPLVMGDGGKLRQAFMNIIRNAFESMPGGGEITIKTSSSGTGALLEFSDTGPGIDPKHIPRIFEMFYSTKSTGLGLGLALTSQIIAEHGGTIRCESEQGKGSSFIVTLPAAPTPVKRVSGVH